MSEQASTAEVAKDKKNVFWWVRMGNAMPDWRMFTKQERTQYRTDITALMCSGRLSEAEASRIKLSLKMEWFMFIASRAMVPVCLFVMYRRGVFQESFHPSELKSLFKIGISMHLMDLTGFFMMHMASKSIVEEHVGINDMSFAYKKKTVDDYLVQKNYFKSKRDNRL